MWRRLLSDNAALALQYAASALMPLLLIPHFVRVLGLQAYGTLAILLAVMSFATVVVQYAFHLTGPAEHAGLRGRVGARQLFMDILVARGLLLMAVLAVAAVALATIDRLIPEQPAVLRDGVLLLLLPLAATLNAGWYLQARGEFGVLAGLSVVSVMVALGFGFFAVTPEQASSGRAAFALGIGPLLLGIGSLIWALARLPRESGRPALAGALQALARGRAAFLSQFVAALYSLAGPLVIGALSGVRAAGLYSAVERPAAALQAALVLTHTAAYPRASALYASGERARYLQLLRQVLLLNAVAVLCLGLLLASQIDAVARFVFGSTQAEGRTLLWLAYAWIALGVFGPMVTGYFTVRGTPREILRLTLMVLLVSLPAGAVGAALFGGAGWLSAAVAGQLVVVARAWRAWREESAGTPASPPTASNRG